jgi:FkbM family methyltransferase
VGANDPSVQSISRGFYEKGWRGITVEPVHTFAEMHRRDRPEDTLFEVAATDHTGDEVTLFEVSGTGLSTLSYDIVAAHTSGGREVHRRTVPTRTVTDLIADAGWSDDDAIHFMTVDVEGAEKAVLEGMDFTRWRPWILVIESTTPMSTHQAHEEWQGLVEGAGYVFCLFDGLSRFYVAKEHAEDLQAVLSYPACDLDAMATPFSTPVQRELEASQADNRALQGDNDRLARLVVRWRALYLDRWAESTRPAAEDDLVNEIYNTVSWRVTKPLRAVRRASDQMPKLRRAGMRIKAAQRATRGRA